MMGFGAAVVLVGVLALPRSAEACHLPNELVLAFHGVAAFAINVPLTIYDGVVVDPSIGHGITEVALATPAVLLGVLVFSHTYSACDEYADSPGATPGERLFTLGMVGWSAALLAHGIYTIVRTRDTAPPPPILIVPVPITSGGSEILGLGIGGRF